MTSGPHSSCSEKLLLDGSELKNASFGIKDGVGEGTVDNLKKGKADEVEVKFMKSKNQTWHNMMDFAENGEKSKSEILQRTLQDMGEGNLEDNLKLKTVNVVGKAEILNLADMVKQENEELDGIISGFNKNKDFLK